MAAMHRNISELGVFFGVSYDCLLSLKIPNKNQSPLSHYPPLLVSVSTCAGFIRLLWPYWEVASSNKSAAQAA